MLITDAAEAMRQAAMDLAPIPNLMATNIHKASARVDPTDPDMTGEKWATLREVADDITDLAGLDKPIAALVKAVADIQAVVDGI